MDPIIRTFYPIGQGGFYTEKHIDININVVYDCGTKSSGGQIEKKIRNAFHKETIDILFLSHFDEDHVNKIHLLQETNTIRMVVLPLLEKIDKILLLNIYSSLGFTTVSNLLRSPDEFFRGSKIIYVRAGNEESDGEEDDVLSIDQLMGADESEYDSRLTIKIEDYWEYIPYNHEGNNRIGEFLELLKKEGLDIDNLKNDISYVESNKQIIREKYHEVSGNINENSLLVYSGPAENTSFNFRVIDWHFLLTNKAGCIFTGDCNFNKVRIKEVYKKKWNEVGTVQVPHHGACKDFNADFLNDGKFICPVNFGNSNSYGHPSIKALETITVNCSIVKLITENTESLYIQNIK